VANRHHREFFLESIVLEGGLPCGPVHFACNSWVQSTRELPTKRVFFSNKVILTFSAREKKGTLSMHNAF
jgi:lipoxygenase